MTTVQDHDAIRSQYAEYRTAIKDVSDSLKPMRPPTAPANDLAEERKSILASSAPNFLIVQVALGILVLCLVFYVMLPIEVAHGLALLLLSVGIAVGIFLSK
jgi:hypothetical protein